MSTRSSTSEKELVILFLYFFLRIGEVIYLSNLIITRYFYLLLIIIYNLT